jgi:hypothetical protein
LFEHIVKLDLNLKWNTAIHIQNRKPNNIRTTLLINISLSGNVITNFGEDRRGWTHRYNLCHVLSANNA